MPLPSEKFSQYNKPALCTFVLNLVLLLHSTEYVPMPMLKAVCMKHSILSMDHVAAGGCLAMLA